MTKGDRRYRKGAASQESAKRPGPMLSAQGGPGATSGEEVISGIVVRGARKLTKSPQREQGQAPRRKIVKVTPLQRDAARLQLKIDERAGRQSSPVIKAVAAAKSRD